MNPKNNKEKRLFVTTNDSNIYTHLINLDEISNLNKKGLILVKNIFIFPENRGNSKLISSVYYSNLTQILFLGFDDGTTIFEKFSEKESEIINILKFKLKECQNWQNFKELDNVLNLKGLLFNTFREIYCNDDLAIFLTLAKKANMIIPILIKLTKSVIYYQPLINPLNAINNSKKRVFQ